MKRKTAKVKKPQQVICPYCGKPAEFVNSKIVYDKSYGMMYLCQCKDGWAYVGVHKGTCIPLGRLADKELRSFKMQAHNHFDGLWRTGKMSRRGAYDWLSEQLQIPMSQCHIGMFDVETCKKVIELCQMKGKTDALHTVTVETK